MVNPQLEDGYTRLANEILEAMARLVLNGSESRCLFVIWRKTYGFHKKEDRIPLSQFAEATGMTRSHTLRALATLEKRNIICSRPDGQYKVYWFQKDHSKWESKSVTQIGNTSKLLPKQVTEVLPTLVTEVLPKQVTSKEKKERFKENDPGLTKSKTAKAKKATNPLIREVTAGINEAYGEPYPEWAKHVRAIEKLLNLNYTVAEIVGCWTDIWRQGDGRFPPLSWVIDRIQSYRRNGNKLPERSGANGNRQKYPGPPREGASEEYYRRTAELAKRSSGVLPST